MRETAAAIMDLKYGDVESSDNDLDITHVVGKELVRDADARITSEVAMRFDTSNH